MISRSPKVLGHRERLLFISSNGMSDGLVSWLSGLDC